MAHEMLYSFLFIGLVNLLLCTVYLQGWRTRCKLLIFHIRHLLSYMCSSGECVISVHLLLLSWYVALPQRLGMVS